MTTLKPKDRLCFRKSALKKGCLLLICFFAISASYAQTVKTLEGTEFWFAFMDNQSILSNTGNDSLRLSLSIAARETTSGTVSIPNLNWYHNFIVESDTALEIVIPNNLACHPYFNLSEKKGIHVTSKKPVSLMAYNYKPHTLDGSCIYPVNRLGSEYYLVSYAPTMGSDITGKSEFLVVATEDSTVIEITPKVALVGRPANTMYSIILNKGETYQNSATSIYADVSGTLVKGAASNGSCKPFAVFSGSQSAYVPTDCWFADHLYEQLLPTNNWGTQFFVAPFALASQYTVNIVAKTNNTVVTTNPINGTSVNLNQGQSYKLNSNTARFISSTKPVSMFLFMNGTECSGGHYGDPAMVIVNGTDQWINYATFSTFDDPLIDTHFVNIVVKTPERNTIYLDGTLIPDNLFSPFTTYPSMSYARIAILNGTHTLHSVNNFQGISYGMGYEKYTSYANNLGSYQPETVSSAVQSICTTSDTLLSAPAGLSDVWWSSLPQTADTLANSTDLLVPASDPANVYTAHGTDPATGCKSSTVFTVENPSMAMASIEASNTAVCNFSDIQIGIDAGLLPVSIQWLPAGQFADPFANTTTLSPESSGWYYANVSSLAPGCYNVLDSIYITLNGGDITGTEIHTEKKLLCFGDTATLELDVYRKIGFDNFNGQIDPALWTAVNGAALDNSCGSHNGDALYFNGASNRSVETIPLDFSLGGRLSFYLKTGSANNSCDDPESGDNMLLQYSLDNGTTWTTFRTFYENYYGNLTQVEEDIPAVAFSANTKLRLLQQAFGGVDEDIWILDHVIISRKDISGPGNWTPPTFISNTTSYTTEVYPENTTTYSVSLTDQGCTYTDSVTIVSDDFSINLEEVVSCDSNGNTFIAHVSDQDTYSYSWLSNTNAYFPDDSLITVEAQINNDTITLGVLSAQGCRMNASQVLSPRFFDIAVLGDTVICLGETTELLADAFLTIFDDFNGQDVNDELWSGITGGFISNNCNVYDGSNLYFGDGTFRSCETWPFDFSYGGVLSFEFALGFGTGYYPNSCSMPTNAQSVKIEYSLDNGQNWTPIISVGPINVSVTNTGFKHIEIEVPPGAYSPATKFRWRQNVSDQYGSNWMLDDVKLLRRMPGSHSFSWFDDQSNLVSSDSTLTITPNASTHYTVEITDLASNCAQSYPVTVQVGQPYSLNLPDVELCSADTVTLSPQPPAGEDYDFKWRFYADWPYPIYTDMSTDSSYTIYADAPAIAVVHSSAPSGCSTIDTIHIDLLFDFEQARIYGDTAVCSGGATNLEAKLVETKLYPCEQITEFQSYGTGFLLSTNYGSVSGKAIVFMGGSAGSRKIVMERPVVNGGNISFYFKSGDGVALNATEPGDDLLLEYSTNNGTSWQVMATIPTYQVFQYQLFTMDFPPAANSAFTLIRLSQTGSFFAWTDIILIDEITISTFSGVPLNYSWTTNNAVFATSENVTVSPLAPGQSYSVTMSDIGGLCSFTDTLIIETFDYSVDAGPDTTVCHDAEITLNGSTDSNSPYTISWSNGANLDNTGTLQPHLVNPVSGDYVLTVSKDNCLRSDTVSVTFLPSQQLSLADTLLKCAQDTLLVDLSGVVAVNWTPNTDIATVSGNSFGFFTSQENDYSVNYEDINGCSYLDSLHITIAAPVSVSLPADTAICHNGNLILVPQSNMPDSAFLWSDGSNGETLLVTGPGIYWTEQITGCGASRDSIVISNMPPLSPTIINLDNVLSATGSFQTYQWIDCNKNEPIAGEIGSSFTPESNGSYALIVSDGNCTDTSNCFTMDYLGIDNLFSNDGLYVNYYSLKNELVVVFGGVHTYDLELFDYSGKLVFRKNEVISGQVIRLDSYAAGIYTVRVGEQTRRIYIQ